MKILVTGAGGLLGSEVVAMGRDRGHDVVAYARADLDVTDATAVSTSVTMESPDWVYHCAAYTAVDRAEDEPEVALRVNRDGAEYVALACRSSGARMLYVSTDYVFSGEQAGEPKPYRPSDPVGPLSVYARTKQAGEEAVWAVLGGGRSLAAAFGGDGSNGAHPTESAGLIVRTGWLYGAGGRNFVTAILERAGRGESLSVVSDQRGRPTWARNFADVSLELMEGEARGVWHLADGGEAAWLDFAREALRLRRLDVPLHGVFSEEWGAAAQRPSYSVLELDRTEERVGRPMMNWRDALERFLEDEAGGSLVSS